MRFKICSCSKAVVKSDDPFALCRFYTGMPWWSKPKNARGSHYHGCFCLQVDGLLFSTLLMWPFLLKKSICLQEKFTRSFWIIDCSVLFCLLQRYYSYKAMWSTRTFLRQIRNLCGLYHIPHRSALLSRGYLRTLNLSPLSFAGLLLPNVPGIGSYWFFAWACPSTCKLNKTKEIAFTSLKYRSREHFVPILVDVAFRDLSFHFLVTVIPEIVRNRDSEKIHVSYCSLTHVFYDTCSLPIRKSKITQHYIISI